MGSGGGSQSGQTARPHVALGQLAVVVDEVLGAPRDRSGGRGSRRGVVGAHVEAGDHEVGGGLGETVGALGASALVGAAKVPAGGEHACAPTVLGEQCAEPSRVAAPGEEDDESRAGGQVGQDRAQVAPDGRDDDGLLGGPPLTGPGEGIAADGGVDAHAVGADELDEGRGDAGAQRVTAGEDDGVGVRLDEGGQRRAKGAGPGHELRLGCVGGDEVEVTAAPDEGRGTADEGAPGLVQTGPPVVPDTHDLDHGRPP